MRLIEIYPEISVTMKQGIKQIYKHCSLTLILLTWRIWRAPNNASKWQMGFNSAFKGLKCATNV